MDQFRRIGEVLGSLKALMVLQDDIQINRRQCCLLLDIFDTAFNTIAAEIKQNLKLEERNTKWKPLEEPLRELYKVFKEGEIYVRRCLDNKDWWGKVISFHQNKDSVEFHIHNLLSCFPVVIEAIETAGEIAGLDQREMQKKKVLLAKKYDRSWNDQELFLWRFGKQYLVSRKICNQIENSIREDRWLLAEAIKQKRSGAIAKNEQRLADVLIKKLNGNDQAVGELLPSISVLLGFEDYKVIRRLAGRSQYKEIHWLGEGFVLRHFFEDIEPLSSEISTLLSLAHPNIVQYLCGFYDEEKKECFLVMELTEKDLYSYLKENSSLRRRTILPLPIIIDIMLQIARGMEYLHSRKIYVGDVNPTNIFLKPRKSMEGYFYVKVSGFGLTSVENSPPKHSSLKQNALDPSIWYAPEVLAEQEEQQKGNGSSSGSTLKCTEKADVYSFGMLCFELLTGKLPFEDSHLQGEQMIKNIRAGERPLFPFVSPKYLVNLTKRCWHNNPVNRPSFSSICRTLRYMKKYLVMNPESEQPDMHTPPIDFYDLETEFLKKHPAEQQSSDIPSVLQIPFQMFVYKLTEIEKSHSSVENPEVANRATPNGSDENKSDVENPIVTATDVKSVCVGELQSHCFDMKSVFNGDSDRKKPSDLRSVCSGTPAKKVTVIKNKSNGKIGSPTGKLKAQTPTRPSSISSPSKGRPSS